MPESTFEMTSDESLVVTQQALADAGFASSPAPNKASSTGPWLSVAHEKGAAEQVRSVVFQHDNAAIHLR